MKHSKGLLAAVLTFFLLAFIYISGANLTGFITYDIEIREDAATHSEPWLYFDSAGTQEVPGYHELIEDISQTFYIVSENPDEVELDYYLGVNDLCVLIDGATGQISCLIDHVTLTGTSAPAIETARNESLRINADDQINTVKYTDFTFQLIPVNDQAYFVGDYPDISILSDVYWSLEIVGEDQELDYPLNFTLVGDPPSAMRINQTSDTTAQLYFDTMDVIPGMPTNLQAGVYNITINLTDNASYNATRPASVLVFELEINSTNFPPEFTTDFDNLAGGVQYENYTIYITAVDLQDEEDELTILVQNPQDSLYTCPVTFPWSIEMLNTSASNATGMINTTLNISHVICRYVDFKVLDGEGGEDLVTNVLLNITNVNDPPIMHEVGIDGNMSNLTVFLWSDFIYNINATDPDELTYNAHEFANLTFDSNNSDFQPDEQTGLINVTLTNSAFIGVHSINLSVTDGEYTDSRVMTLEILDNSPPILNMSLAETEYYQNESILIQFQGTDFDDDDITIIITTLTDFNLSLYEDMTYTYETDNGDRIYNYTINMTEPNVFLANEQVGHHSLNIRLRDEKGASNDSSTQVFNFTIQNTNDPPFFVDPANTIDPIQVEDFLNTVVENVPFEQTIYANDFDLLLPSEFANESLTYSVSNPSSLINDLQIIKLEGYEDRALLSFIGTDTGFASFLIRVTDSEGLYEEQNVTFEIMGVTEDPEIQEIKPYFDVDETIFEFTSIDLRIYESIALDVNTTTNWTEQCIANVTNDPPAQPFVFDAISTYDEITYPDNYVDYHWYINEELYLVNEEVTPGSNSEFVYLRNINQTGIVNVTLVVMDSRYSQTNFTWQINFTVPPREPSYCLNSLEDLNISGATVVPNYFSYSNNKQRFYHPDEDLNMDGRRFLGQGEDTNLIYSVLNPENCGFLDFSFSGDQLVLDPTTTGICIARFVAQDWNNNSVISDEVTIVVTDVDSRQTTTTTVSVPRPIPIPFQEDVDVPKPLTIVFPGNATIYQNQTIQVPVRIENTYTEPVRGIFLSAEMPEHPNITYTFTRDFFPVIGTDQEVTTMLTVTNYREEAAPYELRVLVNVTEPEFTDSATILVGGLEQTGVGDASQVRMTFARDMLGENPECQELNDYLAEAEAMIQRGEIQNAAELVNAVINGCREMIRGEELRIENPGLVRRAVTFSDEYSQDIIRWGAILTLLTIALYMVLGVKNLLSTSK